MQKWEYGRLYYKKTYRLDLKHFTEKTHFNLFTVEGLKTTELFDDTNDPIPPERDDPEIDYSEIRKRHPFKGLWIYNKTIAEFGLEGWEIIERKDWDDNARDVSWTHSIVSFKRLIEE